MAACCKSVWSSFLEMLIASNNVIARNINIIKFSTSRFWRYNRYLSCRRCDLWFRGYSLPLVSVAAGGRDVGSSRLFLVHTELSAGNKMASYLNTAGDFLSGWTTVSFSRLIVIHGCLFGVKKCWNYLIVRCFNWWADPVPVLQKDGYWRFEPYCMSVCCRWVVCGVYEEHVAFETSETTDASHKTWTLHNTAVRTPNFSP